MSPSEKMIEIAFKLSHLVPLGHREPNRQGPCWPRGLDDAKYQLTQNEQISHCILNGYLSPGSLFKKSRPKKIMKLAFMLSIKSSKTGRFLLELVQIYLLFQKSPCNVMKEFAFNLLLPKTGRFLLEWVPIFWMTFPKESV